MIEVGQVLWLKIRFNNSGDLATSAHPCIVISINDNFVEIIQLSSLEDKKHKAFFKSNKVICCTDPIETVINKDSLAQLDNKYTIEKFPELINYRRHADKLSPLKLQNLISSYYDYHANNALEENRIVYMAKEDIITINS